MRPLLFVRRHVSLVVAVFALVLAAGGVGYAAGTVGSADIVDNSIKSVDLRDGAAVSGVDVVNDSLTGADVREATLVGVAHAVLWNVTATASEQFTTLLTIAGMRFDASCVHGTNQNTIRLRKTGPAAILESDLRSTVTASGNTENSPTASTRSRSLASGTGDIINTILADGFFARDVGTYYLHWGTHVMVLQLNAINSAASTHSCLIDGTITLGT